MSITLTILVSYAVRAMRTCNAHCTLLNSMTAPKIEIKTSPFYMCDTTNHVFMTTKSLQPHMHPSHPITNSQSNGRKENT